MTFTIPALLVLFAVLPNLPGSAPRQTAPAAQKPAPFELRATPWRAGDTVRSTNTSHSKLRTEILSSGKLIQSFDQIEDKSSIKDLEVLGADGGGPTKMSVTYHALRFLQEKAHEGSEENRHPDDAEEQNPLEGRTFVLVKTARGFRVLDHEEKPVGEGVATLVLAEESIKGSELRRAGDLLARSLSGRPLAIDAPIDVAPDIARAFVDGRENLDRVEMKVTPRAQRDIEGKATLVFAATLVIDDKTEGPDANTTRIDLTGEVFFDLESGRYTGIELTGRLRLADAAADLKQIVETVGEGPWKISERIAYSRRN